MTGSLLSDHRRGDVETGYVHKCDWYTAFCELPGVDAEAAATPMRSGTQQVVLFNLRFFDF